MNSCLAQPQTTIYSRFLVVFILFFFNHMSALNFNPAPSYAVFLAMALNKKEYRCYNPVAKRLWVSQHVVFWEHKIFHSLPSFFEGHSDSQDDPLHDLFLVIPSILLSHLIPSPTSLLQPILPSTSLLSLPLLRILSTLLLLSPVTLIG